MVAQQGQISANNSAAYATPERPKVKRVALAIFFCGIAASITVALIAAIVIFAYTIVTELLGVDLELVTQDGGGFGFGLAVAAIGSAFNWYFFYLTVPAAWLALGFSIGRFPRRGISAPSPYYRWGAIWGALLVSIVTTIAAGLFGSNSQQEMLTALGGLVGGGAIGGAGGAVCAALFRLIVRPAAQLQTIDAEIFA